MNKSFECPACALEVQGEHSHCPYCNYEFTTRSKSNSATAWLMALLLLLPAIWVLWRLMG